MRRTADEQAPEELHRRADHFGELGSRAMVSAQLPPYQRLELRGARVTRSHPPPEAYTSAVGRELRRRRRAPPLVAHRADAGRGPRAVVHAMSWPRIAFAVGGGGALEYERIATRQRPRRPRRPAAASRVGSGRIVASGRARSARPVRSEPHSACATVGPLRRRRIHRWIAEPPPARTVATARVVSTREPRMCHSARRVAASVTRCHSDVVTVVARGDLHRRPSRLTPGRARSACRTRVFGCTKATVVPRLPGRGASSITRWPSAFTRSSAARAVVDPVADVVEALALAARGTSPPVESSRIGVSSWT